ncbi:DUF1624 domain-containing protein [Gluconobacter wancherniae]|uniref:acyltransferase family protein n=1 Tax=Gluconobacter wancherniae TaxID=1307955 RepID=UPI001B8B2CEA|nr:heparan-alpha-glucosaminide N-acetyltransferase domain-containing protein [Gluconobacter wancherniae]MBS1064159.1 DUF1624 domain-containing protein [Gluconobacter wancherniae]
MTSIRKVQESPVAEARPGRSLAIDVDRGLTIAFMILVNDGMDSAHTFSQLQHSVWNGMTLTDMVFPNFLFLMGSAVIFAMRRPIREKIPRAIILRRAARRALILFAIGILINVFPTFGWTTMRYFGVLQRIAICYFIAVLFYVYARSFVSIAVTSFGLLLLYWVLLCRTPLPGLGLPGTEVPLLDIHDNLANWLDQACVSLTQTLFYTGRLHHGFRDPEGLLSTIPSVATTLFGLLAGLVMQGEKNREKVWRLLCLAGVTFLAGAGWSFLFPLNKNLWTSSYALVCAGASFLFLAACVELFDIRRIQDRFRLAQAVCRGAVIFGSNAIFAYVFSELGHALMTTLVVHEGALSVTLWQWSYDHGFGIFGAGKIASLGWALTYVGLCFVLNLLLWRRRIFLKI